MKILSPFHYRTRDNFISALYKLRDSLENAISRVGEYDDPDAMSNIGELSSKIIYASGEYNVAKAIARRDCDDARCNATR